ncbi:tRNA (adenosine(37)-N6)-dimethylallyltransferase MiaA [Paludicola sp. MB14-C6]|uniref:tRNA (adenosine(37)-N6)-dimethylallyltransferase MiaA n=1 Tax=Paludihabitans sp. MB14-C6 TaxID=3070656 RepID=UPI0027DB42E4|nr:tRNA (adenosine(37)-N6)-dimethylallyltransferase MiaA [Paludicola sp. MB14-C6]WMJ23107.1 tRNA (adenosine(37)-N6)-dimethylallyltransferase MiaA [Paludicola sp. MB14-C6]
MNKIPIIVVVGPTASGKTSLAVHVAKKYNGEVISADSMQIYKEMNIGTAKPTIQEMDGVPHHLIDFLEPNQSFSVADYVALAHKVIADIYSRKKIPVIAGGTGLYVASLLNNIQFSETQSDDTIRNKLYSFAEQNGAEALHQKLMDIDPVSATAIHPNNIPRVVRAIELYELTGITMEEHQRNSRLVPSKYNALKIGLNYKDRSILYQRINQRVDLMIQDGLLEEASTILSSEYASTAMQAIGYKELSPYFNGLLSLDQAIANLKQQTRRYAKRQLTWFRRDDEIQWFYPDEYENIQLLQKNIDNSIDNFINVCYD